MKLRVLANVHRQISIRRARRDDGDRLREITIASRGSWGYEASRFERWAANLDLSESLTPDHEAYVAKIAGQLVAWASLRVPVDGISHLSELWVEPDWIGQGVGSQLFAFIVERARELGARRLEWVAEPRAVGFYERMGGCYLRDTVSRSFGHVVPVMGLDLH